MKITKKAIDIMCDSSVLLIAQQIVGVSPLTPPHPMVHQYYMSTFGGPTKTGRGTLIKKLPKGKNLREEKMFAMDNNYYRNFLRLNNRRKTQTAAEFRKHGYPEVHMKIGVVDEIPAWVEWMDEIIGPYNYFYAGGLRCFFLNDELKTIYLLRWG